MRLPFLKPPSNVEQPLDTHSFCEPVWATPTSRVHIRLLDGERKLGGGIRGFTLCERDITGGWDLATKVEEWLVLHDLELQQRFAEFGADPPTGPLCWDCADRWLALS